MRLLFLAGLILMVLVVHGQPQQYDIITYTPPKGWQKESAEFAVSFVKTNNATGSWCRVTLYKSRGSSGDPLNDFNSEWKELVTNYYPDAVKPQPISEVEDGWTSYSGAAPFQFNNQQAYLLLSTISGYNVEVSVMVLMNSEEYVRDVETLLGSLDLKKPEVQQVVNTTYNSTQQPTNQQVLVVSGAAGKNGISISTTNFDDGWVAQPFADYVRVTKNQTTVLIHYGIEITDDMRANNNVEAVLFDRLILPRYNVSNIRKFDNGGPCYFCVYFFEADAIDKTTGKACHIGFRFIPVNGIAKCIEIISPNAATFQHVFPKQEAVEAMLNYNKFAVTQADLKGSWEESSGSYVNMYNSMTGAYAGMNTSSSANKFIFKGDGSYESTHKGAFGMVGSMQFYDQKYNGKCTVTNWDITLTNQFEGKTEVYWAQFEAVRGGRVLHLTRKSATGIQYHLVKTE